MKLETKRLIIRKPNMSDWKDLVEGLNEFDVAKNMSYIPNPYSEKDAKCFLKKEIKNWGKKDQNNYIFLIELKSEGKVIGGIEIGKVSRFSKTAETASFVNKKYWKNGYITEAYIIVNDFVFNKLKLRRLDAFAFADNKASNATKIKIGYKLEGTQRQSIKSKGSGKIHNRNMYGLLREDWEKARRKLVK